jgi:hypothetical protein
MCWQDFVFGTNMAFDIQGKQAILVQYRRLVAKGVAGMATVTEGNDIMNIDPSHNCTGLGSV